jgi:hypothetical protein
MKAAGFLAAVSFAQILWWRFNKQKVTGGYLSK